MRFGKTRRLFVDTSQTCAMRVRVGAMGLRVSESHAGSSATRPRVAEKRGASLRRSLVLPRQHVAATRRAVVSPENARLFRGAASRFRKTRDCSATRARVSEKGAAPWRRATRSLRHDPVFPKHACLLPKSAARRRSAPEGSGNRPAPSRNALARRRKEARVGKNARVFRKHEGSSQKSTGRS